MSLVIVSIGALFGRRHHGRIIHAILELGLVGCNESRIVLVRRDGLGFFCNVRRDRNAQKEETWTHHNSGYKYKPQKLNISDYLKRILE
jgi:hypothetical protein